MSKQTGKAKETVILIRIPDNQARHSEASLTIQRGDLGSMQQFAYTGLTLSGNIAQAVQAAFVALAKLEAAPPPVFTNKTAPASASAAEQSEPETDESEIIEPTETDAADNADITDTDNSPEPEEAVAVELEALADDPPAETVSIPAINPPVVATPTAATAPANQAQLSLF